MPSRSLLDAIATDEPWVAALEAFRARHPRRQQRIGEYEQLLEAGQHRRIGADVLAGCHQPAPPIEGWLNKADGRKKRVFHYPPPDELLFRAVNRLIQPTALQWASPWCRSFLPGGGARSAFRSILADTSIGEKVALRFDIRDYFNSIDVADLLSTLPEPLVDGPAGSLIAAALRDTRVQRAGTIVDGGRKGVMAGTPLAPLLATLYLRELDCAAVDAGATYSRYSDDILVLAMPGAAGTLEQLVRQRLAERGLDVNETKTSVAQPGDAWDYLGFRYDGGAIRLAPITKQKLRAKTTRLARRMLRWGDRRNAPVEPVVRAFVRRTNLRLYGVRAERAEFSWATWFLPVLSGADDLADLDAHVQREARYAATGHRRASARCRVPYGALVEAGHLPLVSAYWAGRGSAADYEALVSRRTGLG